MDIAKKRIEKYFSNDYLFDERQTFQAKKSKMSKDNIDLMLSTIKLTDNIFALKDKLPEPSYDGRSHRNTS